MDTRLQALAGAQGGAFSAVEAAALGVRNEGLQAAVRAGEIVRLRRGAFVSRTVWEQADGAERYRLRALAVVRSRPGDGLSHHAALAAVRLPLWGEDRRRLDLVTSISRGTTRNGLTLHPREGITLIAVEGVPCVPPARALVGSALSQGLECAVVAGDAALNRGILSAQQLAAEVELLTLQEGRTRAQEFAQLLDAKAQSPGESLLRLIVHHLGLRYESQVELRDATGAFVARVDLLVEGVVVEFDGRIKYGCLPGDKADLAAGRRALWEEKQREDAIRRLGYPVVRVIWRDLDRPGRIGEQIRAARALRVNSAGGGHADARVTV